MPNVTKDFGGLRFGVLKKFDSKLRQKRLHSPEASSLRSEPQLVGRRALDSLLIPWKTTEAFTFTKCQVKADPLCWLGVMPISGGQGKLQVADLYMGSEGENADLVRVPRAGGKEQAAINLNRENVLVGRTGFICVEVCCEANHSSFPWLRRTLRNH